jgi:SPP1 family holin
MNIKTDTIIRTIVLVIALVNQGLAIFGKESFPVTEDQVYQIVTLVATIASAVWAWWKNNSFTKKAIEADNYLATLKSA